MHELAEIEVDQKTEDFEPLPEKKLRPSEGITVVHCCSCGSPYVLSLRHARRGTICKPCSFGHTPEPIASYHSFWLERFSTEEIRQMATAIWGREVATPFMGQAAS